MTRWRAGIRHAAIATVLALGVLLVGGCGHEERPASSGSGVYYTGAMKKIPKGAPAGDQGDAGGARKGMAGGG
jgi:hypothetical protein